MKKLIVNLKGRSYPILIKDGLLSQAGKNLKQLRLGNAAVIITNAVLKRKYGATLARSLRQAGFSTTFLTVIDSEKAKSTQTCFDVLNKLTRFDKEKQVFLVALGGGVVGDLTGFAASIYKRGVPYVQIPTTLLAQVDSAIGGKTAIDLPAAKNLVGRIYQPKAVLIDTRLLKTLPPRQIRAGFAEIIKYALLGDKVLFSLLEKKSAQALSLDASVIEMIEARCVSIKKKIVEQDECEKKGLRTVLNLGHTIGHAIENAGGYTRYNHGEAIAIGLVCASELASKLGLLKLKELRRIIELVRRFHLPLYIKNIQVSKILSALARDKKFIHATNRFVLPVAIGKAIIKESIPQTLIKNIITNHSH